MNNRQNGRRRGRGGNNNQRGGNPGRPDSGNRIDSRARGNANQLYEKYKNLARDAQMSGDRVNTEYYLQFADHYFRVLSESRLRFEEQNPGAPQQRRIQPVDSFDDFDDADDYGDEGEPIRAGEQQGGQQGGQEPRHQRDGRDGRFDGARHDGQRQQPRYDSRRDERYDRVDTGRVDTGRVDNGRGDTARSDNARNEAPRFNGDRRNGQAEETPRNDLAERAEPRFTAMHSPIANDMGEDSPDGSEPVAPEPRRRGRPRRAAAGDDQGAVAAPAALDADRLPPPLAPTLAVVSSDSDAVDAAEPAPRPRRRRTRAAGEIAPLG